LTSRSEIDDKSSAIYVNNKFMFCNLLVKLVYITNWKQSLKFDFAFDQFLPSIFCHHQALHFGFCRQFVLMLYQQILYVCYQFANIIEYNKIFVKLSCFLSIKFVASIWQHLFLIDLIDWTYIHTHIYVSSKKKRKVINYLFSFIYRVTHFNLDSQITQNIAIK